MISAVVTLSVASLVLLWIAVTQIERYNKVEHMMDTVLQNMEQISDLIKSSKTVLENKNLVEAFSTDDEVGTFFNNLQEIQNILNNYIISGPENEQKTDSSK